MLAVTVMETPVSEKALGFGLNMLKGYEANHQIPKQLR